MAKRKRTRKGTKKTQVRPFVPCTHGNNVFECQECLRIRKSLGMAKQ